jgi:hypothetical protein
MYEYVRVCFIDENEFKIYPNYQIREVFSNITIFLVQTIYSGKQNTSVIGGPVTEHFVTGRSVTGRFVGVLTCTD